GGHHRGRAAVPQARSGASKLSIGRRQPLRGCPGRSSADARLPHVHERELVHEHDHGRDRLGAQLCTVDHFGTILPSPAGPAAPAARGRLRGHGAELRRAAGAAQPGAGQSPGRGGLVGARQPVRHLRQGVRATQHAKDAPTHAFGRAAVPLPPVQQVLLAGGQPDGAPTHPLGRKAVPLSRLRAPLLAELVRHHPHAHALGRAAVPLLPLQKGLLGQLHAHQAPAHPFWGKALPVPALPTPLFAVGQPEPAHARACQHLL
ncbi:hypothetical protein HPB47_022602, partial [Ixodes persulcatus]